MRQTAIVVVAALLMTTAAGAAGLATQNVITLEVAKEVAAAAQSYAKKNNWKVNIAICDAAGNLMYFERRLGVQIGSIAVAMVKAESAAKFKRPTKAFAERVTSNPAITMIPGGFAIEGGLPLFWKGELLGSIGVSGVTSQQDGMIAQAGVDALQDILK